MTDRHDVFDAMPVWQRFAIGLPVLAVALVCLAVVVDVVASAGRIHPGVRVSGVAVGGLRVDAAAARVSEQLGERLSVPVTLAFEDEEWEVAADEISATVDGSQAADIAYAVGRTGSPADVISTRVAAWFGGIDLTAPMSADESQTALVLARIAEMVDRPARDASIVIEGTSARLEPAELGIAVRMDTLRDELLRAFISDERRAEIRVDFVPVTITDEDAQDALMDTRSMLAGDVTIVFEDRRWRFSPDRIAGWIAFRTVPTHDATGSVGSDVATGAASGIADTDTAAGIPAPAPTDSSQRRLLEVYIDAAEASRTVMSRIGGVGRPAKNATFKVGGGNVSILPSQDGVSPDIDALALEMTRVLTGETERLVELRMQRVTPDVTTEDAQNMGIKTRIGTYTTTYASGNRSRVSNIHTLANALGGTLVAPGTTFSFNQSVGPRTAAKGYQEAPAIINGRLVPSLGGGICQFGTTIFNTVFESGLPIVERKNHSFYISSYPKGRDATLSWGGPDFKFKNDTEHWILIATSYTSSSLTVSLYGTDPGYEVTSETGPWTDVKPYPVREVPDPELPVGARRIEDAGVNGATIVVKRFVRKGGSLVREDTFRSVYRPKEEVVRVGPKPVPSEAETPTVP